MEIRPLIAVRDYHSTTHENAALNLLIAYKKTFGEKAGVAFGATWFITSRTAKLSSPQLNFSQLTSSVNTNFLAFLRGIHVALPQTGTTVQNQTPEITS